MLGLGLGAFTLDWSTVSSYLYSPLISPFFATVNIFFGYVFFLYVILPMRKYAEKSTNVSNHRRRRNLMSTQSLWGSIVTSQRGGFIR